MSTLLRRSLPFAAVAAALLFAACDDAGSPSNPIDFDEGVEQDLDPVEAEPEPEPDVPDTADDEPAADPEPEPEPEPEAPREADFPEIGLDPDEDWGQCIGPVGTSRCVGCGQPCENDDQCIAGYRCLQERCTRSCVPDEPGRVRNDCGDGFFCKLVRYGLPGQLLADEHYCFAGTGENCLRDADCPSADTSCQLAFPNQDMDGITQWCRHKTECQQPGGAACTKELECNSGLCADFGAGSQCVTLCAGDGECGNGQKCEPRFLFRFIKAPTQNGLLLTEPVYVKLCGQPNSGTPEGRRKRCTRDRECPAGEACRGLLVETLPDSSGRDTVVATRLCTKPFPGGAAVGTPCDGTTPPQCDALLCLGDDVCTRTCNSELDNVAGGAGGGVCPWGMTCRTDGSASEPLRRIPLCRPLPPTAGPCGADGGCPAGSSCGLRPGTGRTLEPACISDEGNVAFGGTCKLNPDTAGVYCRNGLCGPWGSCTQPCSDTAPCPGTATCETVTFGTGTGTRNARVCVPATIEFERETPDIEPEPEADDDAEVDAPEDEVEADDSTPPADDDEIDDVADADATEDDTDPADDDAAEDDTVDDGDDLAEDDESPPPPRSPRGVIVVPDVRRLFGR